MCKEDTMPAKPHRPMLRSKSEGSTRISRAYRKSTPSIPPDASPESVITYLGRSYSLKDLFPVQDPASVTDDNNEVNEEEDSNSKQQQQQGAPVKPSAALAHISRRASSPQAVTRAAPANRRRAVGRTKSAGAGGRSRQTRQMTPSRKIPTRSRSGDCLAQMVASAEERQQPGLKRSTTLTQTVKGLFFDNADEDNDNQKYGIHSDGVRHLHYTQVDVANICDDHREFERLKATIKKQGAITNEVLRQGLHFYVKAKKDREANGDSRSSSVRRQIRHARRTHSEEENETERPAVLRRSDTTGALPRRDTNLSSCSAV